MNISDTPMITTYFARHSRLLLRRYKTCGNSDGNRGCRLAWGCGFQPAHHEYGRRYGGRYAWDYFKIRLLSSCDAPTFFKLLRSYKASAELLSACFFTILEGYDTISSPVHMGFKKTDPCAELVMVVRMSGQASRVGLGNTCRPDRLCQSIRLNPTCGNSSRDAEMFRPQTLGLGPYSGDASSENVCRTCGVVNKPCASRRRPPPRVLFGTDVVPLNSGGLHAGARRL